MQRDPDTVLADAIAAVDLTISAVTGIAFETFDRETGRPQGGLEPGDDSTPRPARDIGRLAEGWMIRAGSDRTIVPRPVGSPLTRNYAAP